MMNLGQTVGMLSVLGDESRLRLCALLEGRELSVGELVRVTGLGQSSVSMHLGRLRDAGFVRDRRAGPHAYYTLSEALPATARAILDEACRADDATLTADRQRLDALQAEARGALPEAFAGEMERHYSPGRTWPSLALGLAALLGSVTCSTWAPGDGAVAALPRAPVSLAHLRRHEPPHGGRGGGAARPLCPRAGPGGRRRRDALRRRLLRRGGAVSHAHLRRAPGGVLSECARVLRPGGRLVVLSLDAHTARDVTAPYGERHAGFSPDTLRAHARRAGLTVTAAGPGARETKKPHFRVVLATAEKPRAPRESAP
jgi:DNA-binding transcriptional ArsR family regulator